MKLCAASNAAACKVQPGRWLQNAFRASGGSISQTAAFREGRISIQDEASQMVPLLLGVAPGDSVLDLCAAPGGKTATFARAAGPGATVVAADRHAHRLAAIRSHLKRLKLRRVEIVELDGTQALAFSPQNFRACWWMRRVRGRALSGAIRKSDGLCASKIWPSFTPGRSRSLRSGIGRA